MLKLAAPGGDDGTAINYKINTPLRSDVPLLIDCALIVEELKYPNSCFENFDGNVFVHSTNTVQSSNFNC